MAKRERKTDRRAPPATLPPSLHRSDPDYVRERYSPLQAALYLLRSTDFVYREVAAGRLSHRRDAVAGRAQGARVKGLIWFSQADLDDWRAAHRLEVSIRTQAARREPDALAPYMPAVKRFS